MTSCYGGACGRSMQLNIVANTRLQLSEMLRLLHIRPNIFQKLDFMGRERLPNGERFAPDGLSLEILRHFDKS